jgi:glycosyltransferase involved in cell wall biosynthesis
MKELSFSVSMCVYGKDNPDHFHEALDSVFNQTLPPDEVVLVVDGPVPNEIDNVIAQFEDNKSFKVVRLPKNVGHGNARKTGLENCTYPYVAIVDADDVNMPERFELQIKCFAEDRDLSIVGGYVKQFTGDINNIICISTKPTEDIDIKAYMKKRCPFCQAAVMFKKEDVIAAGGYIDWYNAEDYYLWIRMYLNGYKFHNLDTYLVYVRVGEEQYRRRGGWRYFRSVAKLYKYMFENQIISLPLYIYNVSIRFVVQVVFPNKLRGKIRNKFAWKAIK